MESERTLRSVVGYKNYPVIHTFDDGLPYSLLEFQEALPEDTHIHTEDESDSESKYIHLRFPVYSNAVIELDWDTAQQRILEGNKKFHHTAELYIQSGGTIIFNFSNVPTHNWGRSAANNTALALENILNAENLFEESDSVVSESEYGLTHPSLTVSYLLLLFTDKEIDKVNSKEEGEEETIVYKYTLENQNSYVKFNLTDDKLEPSFTDEEDPKEFLKIITQRLYSTDFGSFSYDFLEPEAEDWLYPFFLKHRNPGIDFWESIQKDFFNIKEVLRPSEKTEHLKEMYGPIKCLKMFVDLYTCFTHSMNYIFEEQYASLFERLSEHTENLPEKTEFINIFSELEASLETLSQFDNLPNDFVNYGGFDIESGDVITVNSELGPARIKIEIQEKQPLLDLSKLQREFEEFDVSNEMLMDAFWCPVAYPIEVLEISSFEGPDETAEEYKAFIKQNEDVLTRSMLESQVE